MIINPYRFSPAGAGGGDRPRLWLVDNADRELVRLNTPLTATPTQDYKFQVTATTSQARDLDFTDSGTIAYKSDDSTTYELDASDGSSVGSFSSVGTRGIAVRPTSQEFWLWNGVTGNVINSYTSAGSFIQSRTVGVTPTDIDSPRGLAFLDDDHLWAADTANQHIVLYRISTDSVIQTASVSGVSHVGVAVNNDLRVFVADFTASEVHDLGVSPSGVVVPSATYDVSGLVGQLYGIAFGPA